MKLEELMIGDWVHCPQLVDKVEEDDGNCQVKQLHVANLDVYSFKELKYDEIEPIPITPEILEKNGFERFPSSKIISYSDCDITLDYDGNEHVWYFSACNDDVDISIITISYVHELQHALRLCKIDKDIKL